MKIIIGKNIPNSNRWGLRLCTACHKKCSGLSSTPDPPDPLPSATGLAPWFETCLQRNWVTDDTSSISTPQHFESSLCLLRGALHECRWNKTVLHLSPSHHQSWGFSRGVRTEDDRLLWFLNAWGPGHRCLELKTLGQHLLQHFLPFSSICFYFKPDLLH